MKLITRIILAIVLAAVAISTAQAVTTTSYMWNYHDGGPAVATDKIMISRTASTNFNLYVSDIDTYVINNAPGTPGQLLYNNAGVIATTASADPFLGVNLQALDGVTSAADKLFYFTGSGTGSVTTFNSFDRTLLGNVDAPSWRTALGAGTVSSINLTAPAAGITVSGGPITSTGSITIGLANDLAAIEALSGTGYAKRTGTDLWSLSATVPTTDLAGTLQAAQFPALTGDVTTIAGGIASTIGANKVIYADIQQASGSTLLGRSAGTTGNVGEITLGATLSFSGAALQTAAHTGDVTTSANSFATTIAANAVTNAKMATMANNTVKSNISGSTAVPADNSISSILDTISATQGSILYRNASGWVSLGPGTSGNILQTNGAAANPSWVAPTGGGSGTVDVGTIGYLAYYPGSTAEVGGNANITVSGGILSLGKSGTIGGLNLFGNTSGTVSILPQAAAGTYNFNLPITAGSSGQWLASAGGVSSPMTWVTPATIATSGSGGDLTANSVTNAKLATMAADTFKANATNGSAAPTDVALAASQLAGRGATGDIAAITLGTGLSMTGTTLNASAGIATVTWQVFTASGTYTPHAGMIVVDIKCVGGGAGGSNGSSTNQLGGSGGGGEYAEVLETAAQIGASKSVTIGAGSAATGSAAPANGGTTSIGSLFTAVGGHGIAGNNPYSSVGIATLGGAGGTGGTTTTGTEILRVAGEAGGPTLVLVASSFANDVIGIPGKSKLGASATPPVLASTNTPGTAGLNYGSGGTGGFTGSTGTGFGGAGSAGICIMEEFNSQ